MNIRLLIILEIFPVGNKTLKILQALTKNMNEVQFTIGFLDALIQQNEQGFYFSFFGPFFILVALRVMNSNAFFPYIFTRLPLWRYANHRSLYDIQSYTQRYFWL